VVRPSRIGFFSELWRFNEFRMACRACYVLENHIKKNFRKGLLGKMDFGSVVHVRPG
jgi:hypothetical protein